MVGYVTAFAGRRDGYQIPLALQQAGRLDLFVTTFYAGPLITKLTAFLPGIGSRLAVRRCEALSDGKIVGGILNELIEHLGRRLKVHPPKYWRLINKSLSQRAGYEAERRGSNLLLYEPYAWEAFRRPSTGPPPKKVLFHFHPHPLLEREVLTADSRATAPTNGWDNVDGGSNNEKQLGGAAASWALADRIFCASSFTQRSLIHAGAPAEKIVVIPYGSVVPSEPLPPSRGRFRALFVGSGIQRKGLHHLLGAWKRARLPAQSELTLVCRVIDPGMRQMLDSVAGLRFFPGTSVPELERLIMKASLIVMPSLVEGFGHIFLEAAARGRPVLGTHNTCVADLGEEQDGFFLCQAGNTDDLAQKLEQVAAAVMDDPGYGRRAWATARRFPWNRFRSDLVRHLP